jgi:putative membrane protein
LVFDVSRTSEKPLRREEIAMTPPPQSDVAGPKNGNRTRDHLANERTFLAWIRTGLGLIGLGFVLSRMGLFLRQLAEFATGATRHDRRAVHEFLFAGVVFLVAGTLLCAWSGWRYQQARLEIESESFRPANHSVLVVTLLVVSGGIAIVGLVFWRTLVDG